MYRKKKVKIEWSANFAYIIGIITTDGNLSIDGRHINITSKDKEVLAKAKLCLNIDNKIGVKARGGEKEKKYFALQFGDINFYEFLLDIGLMPKKSKKLKSLKIPDQYFADFLRGCIDGDGSISISNHPESKHKQLKVRLYSASLDFSLWMLKKIKKEIRCSGGSIYTPPKKNVYSVCFGKADSIKILKFMYYKEDLICLERKRKVAKKWASGATG